MRKYFFVGIFLGAAFLPVMLTSDSAYYAEPSNKPKVIATPSPTPTIAAPQRLLIEKLSLDVLIEHVGLDTQGAMDIPQNEDNVAWYQFGAKPGETGNAVIAGHFDKVTGAPAVFYRLSSLSVGDRIIVIAQDSQVYTYAVTDKKVYPYNQVPLEEVFGDHGKKRLNLITCKGIFNQRTRNYSDRIVVYSELID